MSSVSVFGDMFVSVYPAVYWQESLIRASWDIGHLGKK